ncbi:hypothetical protein WR25_24310 [Diploscapter pachys]|uniref:G-protein coupled receptors family 1 profile domain-containing protein n=1 Tax=Diploscapter pachys TaxID=2018661 RepID=A0A2A2LRA5_9BILA|nr:hypothetical protein WR25_24310 [Diploscapter pachys]
MFEDFLYELLPVFGFTMCASCIFIILTLKSEKGALKIWLFFAITDLFFGATMIYAGFYGVLFTIYGNSNEVLNPFDCFPAAFHIPSLLFYDHLHLALLIFATLDRFINIVIPVEYVETSKCYQKFGAFGVIAVCAALSIIPSFQNVYETRENDTIKIGIVCLLDEIVGESGYVAHLFFLQWTPIICIGILALVLLIYACRHLKQKWNYNWSEDSGLTKQTIMAIFVRCFLSALSIHLPMLFLEQVKHSRHYMAVKDYIIRMSYALVVPIFQPMWHLIIIEKYSENIGLFFNRYSYNTERKWQSMSDPPLERTEVHRVHLDRHGDVNPFGSWYSSTGNVAGEAGIPVDQQRSVSFYNN